METIKLEFPDGIVECNVLGSFQAEGTYNPLATRCGEVGV